MPQGFQNVQQADVRPENLDRELLAKRTPQDLFLRRIINKTTGERVPPRGALRRKVAVLGAYNSYNGVIPPSWANGYPSAKKVWMEMPRSSLVFEVM